MPADKYPYLWYPPYVSGSFYVLAPKALELLNMAARKIPLFKFDDVYLGILAYAMDITPSVIEQVYFYPIQFDCDLFANKIIAVHKFSGHDMLDKWNEIESQIKFEPDSFKNLLEY